MKTPLHLIIEGSDRVGKTTICKLLSTKLKIPIIKMTNVDLFLDLKLIEEASELFNKTIAQFKDFNWILDRGYPSSLIYSEYFKRDYDFTYLDRIIFELKPKIIILHVEPRERDDIYSLEDQKNLAETYKRNAQIRGWKLIDCTNLTPEETCYKIINQI